MRFKLAGASTCTHAHLHIHTYINGNIPVHNTCNSDHMAHCDMAYYTHPNINYAGFITPNTSVYAVQPKRSNV